MVSYGFIIFWSKSGSVIISRVFSETKIPLIFFRNYLLGVSKMYGVLEDYHTYFEGIYLLFINSNSCIFSTFVIK